MNDFKKGQIIFGVGTNYDYYLLQNNDIKNYTTIIDIYDNEYIKNLYNWKFIPSGCFDEYEKILCKDNDENVEVLHDYSSYETRKKWISKEKTGKFLYPVCYTITISNGITNYYSSKRKKHFDIPKVLWSNGLGTYPIIDKNGEYGLTQFSYAIIDKEENLENIKKALNSNLFINIMKCVKFTNNKYNHKVIKLFKKDFWKEFV